MSFGFEFRNFASRKNWDTTVRGDRINYHFKK